MILLDHNLYSLLNFGQHLMQVASYFSFGHIHLGHRLDHSSSTSPSHGQLVMYMRTVDYAPAGTAPISMIGEVGLSEPSSFSTVIAKALASTPAGIFWSIMTALPCSSGLKTPAAMGAPCILSLIHISEPTRRTPIS